MTDTLYVPLCHFGLQNKIGSDVIKLSKHCHTPTISLGVVHTPGLSVPPYRSQAKEERRFFFL